MSDYIARLDDSGMTTSPWYTDHTFNPYAGTAYGLPNCTAYVCGRWGEIAGYALNPPQEDRGLYNAWEWIDRAQGHFATGNVPALGAIACWYNAVNPSRGGHVAVVEIIGDGYVVTSNSAYESTYFWTQTCTTANNDCVMAGYTFRGYIYLPADIQPQPIGQDMIPILTVYLRRRRQGGYPRLL